LARSITKVAQRIVKIFFILINVAFMLNYALYCQNLSLRRKGKSIPTY